MSVEVSVIVPSYNHAAYLRPCIESALAQDADLEVIVVDDCSADESLAVARSIPDPRLRVLANPRNVGAYATQNRALDEATGEFVAVLNSDDLWWPGKLGKQLTLLRDHPDASFCYTLGCQVDEQGRKIDAEVHGSWPRDERQDLLAHLLVSNRLLASSVVFRRGAARFEETLRYSGDWVAALHMSERRPCVCVAEELTGWRQHGSNSYHRSQEVTLEEIRIRRAILRAARHWLSLRDDKGAIRRALSECAVHLTALYVLVGHMREAKAAAGLALRHSPGNAAAHKRLAVSLMPAVLARQQLWGGERMRLERGALRNLPPLDLAAR